MKLSKQALIALGITSAGVLPDGALAQEHLDRMLAQVAETPSTSTTEIGAMCYVIMMPLERMDYVCPLCKTKTHHESENWGEPKWQVEKYRKQMKHVKELGAEAALDETDLCSQCRRDKDTDTNAANLYILVWVDKRVVRTQLKKHDLTKVIAFLEKKDVWLDGEDEYPLKGSLPRIRTILGLDRGEDKKDEKP